MSAMGNLVLEIQDLLEDGVLVATAADIIAKRHGISFDGALELVSNVVMEDEYVI